MLVDSDITTIKQTNANISSAHGYVIRGCYTVTRNSNRSIKNNGITRLSFNQRQTTHEQYEQTRFLLLLL